MSDRRAIADHLYAQGVLLKHIAEHLGVSHQRVSQLITVPRRGRGNAGKPMTRALDARRQEKTPKGELKIGNWNR